METRYFVRVDEVPAYNPKNHVGTMNRRLIGPDNVGAHNLEVVLGVIQKGPGALPHAHPNLEQVCYLLEGRARVEVAGYTREIGPGDCCFFPPGEPHRFAAVSEEPVKVLVIYSPPYLENSEKTSRL
ncbi:MAG: cupin domain-containing protein [Syntrophaceae bacterium]|nr:cupin domain-containing protein [Syntrophaceae bacterium]